MPMSAWMNVEEAAAAIGCTTGRIRQMLADGTLKGEKLHARAWAIPATEVERIQEKPYTTGRPRKNSVRSA